MSTLVQMYHGTWKPTRRVNGNPFRKLKFHTCMWKGSKSVFGGVYQIPYPSPKTNGWIPKMNSFELWPCLVSTVDGRNSAPPGMYRSTSKSWDIYHINLSTGEGFLPLTVCEDFRGIVMILLWTRHWESRNLNQPASLVEPENWPRSYRCTPVKLTWLENRLQRYGANVGVIQNHNIPNDHIVEVEYH